MFTIFTDASVDFVDSRVQPGIHSSFHGNLSSGKWVYLDDSKLAGMSP